MNYLIKDGTLTDIAEAIRAKTGETGKMTAAEMSGKIADIQTGGDLELTSIEITSPPKMLVYTPGDKFSTEGMVVTVTAVTAGGDTLTGVVNDYAVSPDRELTESDTFVTVSYSLDGSTVTATIQIVVITSAKIYGVVWDGSSTTKWTRTDDAAEFDDPVPYVSGATEYNSQFDLLMPWAGMVVEERTAGTMVAIPKFWYRLTQVDGKGLKIQITDQETAGFSVSPAHMDRGDGVGERDTVYIGRYHCVKTGYADTNYRSTTGKSPMGSQRMSTFQSSLHSLGDTIWMSDFAMRFTLWLLYLVEYADWDSQTKIGYGCAASSSTANTGRTDSMPYHTGTTASSRTTYGYTQYRNIESLWDSVLDWMDGCYNNSSGLNIILNPNNFSDSSGAICVGLPSSGYPSAFAVSDAAGFSMFYPTESDGSETTYSCDTWEFEEFTKLCVGSNGIQSKKYGLFGIVTYSYSTSSANIGARCMELPGTAA